MSTHLLSGKVAQLVYGGFGIVHLSEGTAFVPGVMPGEDIHFTIKERSKGVLWAELQDIITPHRQRIQPPCPLAGECGGCAWQHIPPDLQLRYKQDILQDSFTHQFHLPAPLQRVHSSPAEGYRVRARMKPDEQGRLGFVRRRSHQIVAISRCLLFCQAINEFLAHWNQDPPPLKNFFQVDILFSPSEPSLGIHLSHPPTTHELARLQRQFPDVKIGWPGQPVTQTIQIPGQDSVYQVSPAAFFQVNHFLWPTMLDAVSRHLPSHFQAIDLYSGVGFLLPPLFKGDAPPLAVESHPLSASLSRQTFPQLTILSQNTDDITIPPAISLALCDPPRSGLSPRTLELILESHLDTLLYISCNQPTMLRDIKRLNACGWKLQKIECFDLFPHTPHLELFAKICRG